MSDSTPLRDQAFVDRFNDALASLNCDATVVRSKLPAHRDSIELLDDERQFVTFLPLDATPDMTVIAYRLYAQGLHRGLRAGEELAWSKLRHLIGAAGVDA